MNMKTRIIALLAVAVLAGCATTQRTSTYPPTGDQGVEQPTPEPRGQSSQLPERNTPEVSRGETAPAGPMPPRSADEASSPAVRSLLGRADTLARNGNMDMAASTLERALDLEPRNPFIYQRLAAVKLAQGQPGQAEAMARKSNSVGGNNPFVRADNWQLIAEARRTAGDSQGASEAASRAENYHRTSLQLSR
ncbi:tetratricopeptide repeat protein [Salinisphaera sp. T31B1]|uniref:tetratricopeptide repeat protein n=1 Tax=Salinisphaera sp. T31B1 TaxID=727963 RepID=UPI003341AC67